MMPCFPQPECYLLSNALLGIEDMFIPGEKWLQVVLLTIEHVHQWKGYNSTRCDLLYKEISMISATICLYFIVNQEIDRILFF